MQFDDFFLRKICTYQLKWRKLYPNSSLGWLHHPHYVQCTDIGHHHLPTNGYKWWAVLVSKTSMHFTMEPNYLWKKPNCKFYFLSTSRPFICQNLTIRETLITLSECLSNVLITRESNFDEKNGQEMFNWSEVHS